jgi:hypothetical protein
MSKIVTFLFFCIALNSIAQQAVVKGFCLDKKGKPVENVKVFCEKAIPSLTYTDTLGAYVLTVSLGDTIQVVYRTSDLEESRTYIASSNSVNVPAIRLNFQQEIGVSVYEMRQDPFELPTLKIIDVQNIPLGNYERFLTYTTAATSNNELTTNYNVRGGSYDENLVYVNGFNIYRPFLTRSGQQEGMSFINSALVGSVKFSAGGFDAQYGDKLSSVLDIEYKKPKPFAGSVMASLLGVELHTEQEVNSRFSYLFGARYRSNGYLLNSLPTKGAYNPVFWDAQFLSNYKITEKLTWSLISHFASNNYRFTPQSQKTDFGTANEAYSFMIYFDGKEDTRFQTMMGGTALKWQPTKKTNLDLYATVFNTVEREYFDIQGQYYINQLETDPSKEEYGDSIAVLGVGTFLNHARNKLNATIINLYHNGSHEFKNGFKEGDSLRYSRVTALWGVNYQHDIFTDVLSEWKMIDSAGYSVPQGSPNSVELFETIKSNLQLSSERFTGFVQLNSQWSKTKKNHVVSVVKKMKVNGVKSSKMYTDTISESTARLSFSFGTRAGYTTANNEGYITPRMALTYFPRIYMVNNGKVARRNISFRLATGLYYQPPFYREFRTFNGNLNLNVKAQKSFHFVTGTDVYFNMWGREVPFKFTAEAYYKYMWDVNPYEIDNVRTRYYATNGAVAYAYGIDMNIHGQFVEGIESYFKMGLMRTREDLRNDSYKEYYNAAGEKIIFGYSDDQIVVDSTTIYPGFIPKPTDQWLTFGALVQDQMPGFERFTVQMGLQYGSRLPYGPPDLNRYKDTLRMKSYFRVDIGMSYDLLYEKKKESFFRKTFTDAILSFEVFNLLGINNVLSKQWIQDVEGKYYSIPNYLTQRRFNLKLILRF